MLTVGDNELAMGDDDDALSEVAKGEACVEVPGNSCGWAIRNLASWVRSTKISGECGNKNMT